MTRLPLSIAFALVAVLPALGEDVPFAAPPPQSSTYLASLGDIMGKIQLRHIKLWYAIKSKNWDLSDYELAQLRNSFESAVVLYRNIPVEYIVSVDKPLIGPAICGQVERRRAIGTRLRRSHDRLQQLS